jgi:hypothetical protein
MTTAFDYRPEGRSAASAWEDDGGRSYVEGPVPGPEPVASAIPDGLDWSAFSILLFPGRRRHDFEAVTAYETYRNGVDPAVRP